MLKFPARFLTPITVGAVLFTLAPVPSGNAAVGALLSQVPQGEISCATAQAYWTNDADYQSKVAQAQALAAFDERGNQILSALAQVDAVAESCGLKGTVGDATVSDESEVIETAEGAVNSQNTDTSEGADTTGTSNSPITDANAVFSTTEEVPTKSIEVLGQGQVEVPDAEAMVKNYLRQLTIIV